MLFRLQAFAAALAMVATAQDTPLDHFEKKIRPVLVARCYSCHSTSAAAPQGGLLVDSARGLRQGGRSGPLFQPGDPARSLLMRAIRYTDKNLKMPPDGPLPPDIQADFERWIREGAPMPVDQPTALRKPPALWSLQRPQRSSLPPIRN